MVFPASFYRHRSIWHPRIGYGFVGIVALELHITSVAANGCPGSSHVILVWLFNLHIF
jgi:hypothetical protein